MSRSLRSGQIVSHCSPGAIIDIGDESFVACAIECWNQQGMTECSLPRLSSRIGVARLLKPKTEAVGFGKVPKSVALYRFPSWMFCQTCHRMERWSIAREADLEDGKRPRCRAPECNSRLPLVPFRFVQICDRGHLSDVDWMYWVHARKTPPCQNRNPNRLRFGMAPSGGSGLGSLAIECLDCGARESLGELMTPRRMRCRGIQPWHRHDQAVPCDAAAFVVQRGDSNVHFPMIVSALDIPAQLESATSSRLAALQNHSRVAVLRTIFSELVLNDSESSVLSRLASTIKKSAQELAVTEDELVGLIRHQENQQHASAVASGRESLDELRHEEFRALSDPATHASGNFEGDSYEPDCADADRELGEVIQSVSLIRRLREVRVVRGFHRHLPRDVDQLTSVAESARTDWLPASEVYGEGIFIRLNQENMALWRATLPASEIHRTTKLGEAIQRNGIGFLPDPAPEFIAMHGFAHLLLRQLAFDCGYASSSLRERIYCEPQRGQFGILVYTADGDSEGTLGGLVRQGEKDRLTAVIARALQSCSWCSGDPLCFEGENQGMGGLNRAACHACMLVSETSCECANALLDRRFLIGDRAGLRGLFRAFMDKLGIA
jgi:hypothetical protein